MIRYQLLGFFIAAVVIGYIIYRRHFYDKNGENENSDEENDRAKK